MAYRYALSEGNKQDRLRIITWFTIRIQKTLHHIIPLLCQLPVTLTGDYSHEDYENKFYMPPKYFFAAELLYRFYFSRGKTSPCFKAYVAA